MNAIDYYVIQMVNTHINQGVIEVDIPTNLLEKMTDEGRKILEELCDINKVEINMSV